MILILVKVCLVLAAMFDVLQARAIAEGMERDIEHVIGLMVGNCRCSRGELHESTILSYRGQGRPRNISPLPEQLDSLRSMTHGYRRCRQARAGSYAGSGNCCRSSM